MEIINFTINQLYSLFTFMLSTWWLSVIIFCFIINYIVSLIRSINGKND